MVGFISYSLCNVNYEPAINRVIDKTESTVFQDACNDIFPGKINSVSNYNVL